MQRIGFVKGESDGKANRRSPSLFHGGRLLITPGIMAEIQPEDVGTALCRHLRGDWGEALCSDDRAANDRAVIDGSRLLSAYVDRAGVKFWVITEAADDRGQRAATTVLLPAEY